MLKDVAQLKSQDLFGATMHPNRARYPDDMTLFWLRRLREHWYDWTNHFWVAVDTDEKGEEVVVGMAEWQRQGAGAKGMELNPLDPRNLLKPLSIIQNRASAYIYPNRAADPSTADLFDRAIPYSMHHWAVGTRAENWYLDILAVDPAYQGRGFGRQLVEWGLERAKKENVHASLISSYGNEGFYQRCGYGDIVGWASEGEGNPIAHVRGGAIMFMVPKVETAEEGRKRVEEIGQSGPHKP
ncbi:hypothetical protein W97_06333 [Coniosporium apollinis CBS 100218]|uniref:N-acetyltransferase domain-containing protein n=1 Tax=Coniosporium apollinis (strain CBS 100218) TaxID=1168221 RepID=R7YYR2_CONA1|nr:uncharacterized protein W97_06333 [Coniosporium apollinis CBS 100218]EON66929.1 hypothetical protein W97_06333 [Coniosporium apollinis CBS 100218]